MTEAEARRKERLWRGPPQSTLLEEATGSPAPTEVGWMSHCRRHFWEAAVCKHEEGVDGLQRIDAIFAADSKVKKLTPSPRGAFDETSVPMGQDVQIERVLTRD